MRLYLAGPMTGIPRFNFPMFDVWAAHLRGAGFKVLSPHETDTPEVQAAARASAFGHPGDIPGHGTTTAPETLAKNVAEVATCEGVALLPGWAKSSGSRHEVETAVRLGLPVAPVALWQLAGADVIEGYLMAGGEGL